MSTPDFSAIAARNRNYFRSGATRPVAWREGQLTALRAMMTALLASGTIYHGGKHDRADKFIAPTVLVNVSPDSPVMQEEIFGPILPVLQVDSLQQGHQARRHQEGQQAWQELAQIRPA
jgi:acyl-CoA reductase-like NAD-dependent aldehyde dehydrogenase